MPVVFNEPLTFLQRITEYLEYATLLETAAAQDDPVDRLMVRRAVIGYFESFHQKSLVMRKPAFCICENKDADQLRGNCEADQRHCFHLTDSTIPLLPKSEISCL